MQRVMFIGRKKSCNLSYILVTTLLVDLLV